MSSSVIKSTERPSWCRYTAEEARANWERLHSHSPKPQLAYSPRIRKQPLDAQPHTFQDTTYQSLITGVGTELKRLLSRFGIVARPNCKCDGRAMAMDVNGVKWCEEHLEEIVDWLEEEARNRYLPFARLAGRILVRRAIRNAKRKMKIVEQDQ